MVYRPKRGWRVLYPSDVMDGWTLCASLLFMQWKGPLEQQHSAEFPTIWGESHTNAGGKWHPRGVDCGGERSKTDPSLNQNDANGVKVGQWVKWLGEGGTKFLRLWQLLTVCPFIGSYGVYFLMTDLLAPWQRHRWVKRACSFLILSWLHSGRMTYSVHMIVGNRKTCRTD